MNPKKLFEILFDSDISCFLKNLSCLFITIFVQPLDPLTLLPLGSSRFSTSGGTVVKHQIFDSLALFIAQNFGAWLVKIRSRLRKQTTVSGRIKFTIGERFFDRTSKEV